MILGFAHVAIGCVWNGGFSTNYRVPSSEKKWGLLRNKPKFHDLVVNMPSRLVPIELVNYDTGLVKGKSRIRIKRQNHIQICARNVDDELTFFSCLGSISDSKITINSKIKQWETNIRLRYDELAPIDPPLDIEGYQALAFYVTDIDSDMDRLIDAGGRDETGLFPLFINGKHFEIGMLRSPEGTIIELIKVKTDARD